MSRLAYVNGDILPLEEAKVSILDRGFLFADGVYEVTAIIDGRMVDNGLHLERLARSLRELDMASPVPLAEIPALQEDLIRRNGVAEGRIYLQITRGAAERDFHYPADATPTLVMFTQEAAFVDGPAVRQGVPVITVPDIRWKRRDIKSIALLPQAMAKQAAVAAGAGDAWMVEDGYVTEGTASNAYIITKEGTIVTRPLNRSILAGCTRKSLLALAEEHDLAVEERLFTVDEAYAAAEAFLTSATALITPVTRIDERPIGDGRPGPLTRRLCELYVAFARNSG